MNQTQRNYLKKEIEATLRQHRQKLQTMRIEKQKELAIQVKNKRQAAQEYIFSKLKLPKGVKFKEGVKNSQFYNVLNVFSVDMYDEDMEKNINRFTSDLYKSINDKERELEQQVRNIYDNLYFGEDKELMQCLTDFRNIDFSELEKELTK